MTLSVCIDIKRGPRPRCTGSVILVGEGAVGSEKPLEQISLLAIFAAKIHCLIDTLTVHVQDITAIVRIFDKGTDSLFLFPGLLHGTSLSS